MKKELNRGVMTRKGYRVREKVATGLAEMKNTIIVLTIGFVIGVLYSTTITLFGSVMQTQSNEKIAVMQIDQKQEKPRENHKNDEEKCTLDETSCLIKKYADEYGLDYKLAIAISKHETASYTSYAFKSLNNVGGMMYWNGSKMQLKYFENLNNGIDAFIKNLKFNYIDLGLDTIEKIQSKYAPIGINDNGTNQYWVSGVSKYYEELN